MSALFANEKNKSDNPFYDVDLPESRAFYHPTLPKKLSKKTKGISLSPERVKSDLRASKDRQHVKGKELSPGEKGFLSGSNTMLAKELPTHDTPSPGPADASSKFDESWPASERPSTIESPGEVQNVSSASAVTSHSTESGLSPALHGTESMTDARGKKPTQGPDGTLARLIDRFRFGAPQSREERARQPATGSKDFWWLSSSSSSPPLPSRQPSSSSISSHAPLETTPICGTGPAGGVRGVQGSRKGTRGGRERGRGAWRISSWSGISRSGVSSLSSSRRVSSVSTLTSSSNSSLKVPASVTDKEIEEIQRRAEKLLEISEGTLLSEPAVSSDGLGSFSTSSPITDDTTPPRGDEAYTSRLHDKENLPRPPLFPANLSYTQSPNRPKEDILQQWRRTRRMEQAKEGALHRVSGRMTQGPLRQTQAENISTRRDGNAKNEDADSKLADFRRRLQRQRLLTEARVSSNIKQVPVKDTTKTHTGTDPIPQSIATQTRTGVSSCVQSGSGSLSADQTTCLQQERSDTMQDGDEELLPVASPNIQGIRTQRAHEANRLPDVTPHLHMSCDILPCGKSGPHVHTVRHVKDKEESAGHGKMHHHQPGMDNVYDDHDNHFGRESFVRNNVSGNWPQRQTLLPSEDQRVSRQDQRGFSVPKASLHQERRPAYEPEPRTDEEELHERHLVSGYIEGEDQVFQGGATRNNTRTTSSKDVLGRGSIRSSKEEGQILDAEHHLAAENTRTFCQPQASTKTRTRTLKESPEDSTAATTTGGIDAGPVAKQRLKTDDVDDVEGAKRQLDFGSSSPINNAIGQVISNRMFSSPVGQRSVPSSQRSTPSSFRSSVLSQDTLMFTPPIDDHVTSRQRMQRGNISEPAETGALDSESRTSSDSEEFRDDEMLQVLRKQREECIQQLSHLDNLLSHTSKD